jgi:hypothetical protein
MRHTPLWVWLGLLGLVLGCATSDSLAGTLEGAWDFAVSYNTPSAACQLFGGILNYENTGFAGHDFDADSLVCNSAGVGVERTHPDPTIAVFEDTLPTSLRFTLALNPLVVTELKLCGRFVASDRIAGHLCADNVEYGDSVTGTWSGRRR